MAQKQKIAGVQSRKRKGVDYWYARIDSHMVYFGKRLSNRASSYDPRGKIGVLLLGITFEKRGARG
jgi:hypothetical protein